MMMKKLILVLGLLGMVTACSLNDDDGIRQQVVVIPIDSVQVPDTLIFGKTEKLSISYTKPNSCYSFYRFQTEGRDSIFGIGVVNTVTNAVACDSTSKAEKKDLEFKVLTEGAAYTFKFFQGNDANGEAKYLTKRIPVKKE